MLISSKIIRGDRATIVELTIPSLEWRTFRGEAIRSKEDKNDLETARLLAWSRALARLSKYCERQAWGRIKQADNARQRQTNLEKNSVITLKGLAENWYFAEYPLPAIVMQELKADDIVKFEKDNWAERWYINDTLVSVRSLEPSIDAVAFAETFYGDEP